MEENEENVQGKEHQEKDTVGEVIRKSVERPIKEREEDAEGREKGGVK